jgi:hypothetical protein
MMRAIQVDQVRLLDRFRRSVEDVGDVRSLVLAVSRLPYGRPTRMTPSAVIDERRGTCTVKHVLLECLVPAVEPNARLKVVHRVYRVTRELARERWGADIAGVVPEGGMNDVHTFGVLHNEGMTVRVDATFPIERWDGRSDLPLACGDGTDVPAGDDALVSKRVLVTAHCDARAREPFLAALVGTSTR